LRQPLLGQHRLQRRDLGLHIHGGVLQKIVHQARKAVDIVSSTWDTSLWYARRHAAFIGMRRTTSL
jgi:hypothetical protein